ncbi:hypothetical protein [Caulobacter segnis]
MITVAACLGVIVAPVSRTAPSLIVSNLASIGGRVMVARLDRLRGLERPT